MPTWCPEHQSDDTLGQHERGAGWQAHCLDVRVQEGSGEDYPKLVADENEAIAAIKKAKVLINELSADMNALNINQMTGKHRWP